MPRHFWRGLKLGTAPLDEVDNDVFLAGLAKLRQQGPSKTGDVLKEQRWIANRLRCTMLDDG
jgi:hypothetical protein